MPVYVSSRGPYEINKLYRGGRVFVWYWREDVAAEPYCNESHRIWFFEPEA